MNKKQVSVLFVSIGGYGRYYLETMFNEISVEKANVCGVVDPYAEKAALFPEIQRRGIPIFADIEDFYRLGHTADLVVISSPIHFHVLQSCVALKNGSQVLCDKPIGATVQEVDELIKIRDESGKWVMIGYQWSYSKAIQDLKKDIMKGKLGRPFRLKTLCLWPRDDTYYQRNGWAGRIKDNSGKWVLDSPVNNAVAHYLHNMFYVLGQEVNSSAIPKEVTAECCRANPIENYDTAACRIQTTKNVEILFYVSHATLDEIGPIFHFEFEKAVVSYGKSSQEIVARFKNGSETRYGRPDDTPQFSKLFQAVDTVIKPQPLLCPPEAARSQTVAMNGVQESAGEIINFPKTLVHRDKEKRRFWVTDLSRDLEYCYLHNILPSEARMKWGRKGKTVHLDNYNFFPSHK